MKRTYFACITCRKKRRRCHLAENGTDCDFCIEHGLQCTWVVRNSESDLDPKHEAAIRSDSSTSPKRNPEIQQSQAIPPISDLDRDDVKADDSDTLTHLNHVTEEIHPKDHEQVSAQILPQDPAVAIEGEVGCVQAVLTTNCQQPVFEGALESTPNIEFAEIFPYCLNNHFILAPSFPNVPAYAPTCWPPLQGCILDPQAMLPVSDHLNFGVGGIDDHDTKIAPYSSISTSATFSLSSELQKENPDVDHSSRLYFSSEYDVNHTRSFPLSDSASKRIRTDEDPLPPKRQKSESHCVSLSEVMKEAAYEYIQNRLLHLTHGAKASCKDQPAKVLQKGIFDVTRDRSFEEESKLDEDWCRDESKKLLDDYKREVSKIGTWEETDYRYDELCKMRGVFWT